jgi:hypothetical protein
MLSTSTTRSLTALWGCAIQLLLAEQLAGLPPLPPCQARTLSVMFAAAHNQGSSNLWRSEALKFHSCSPGGCGHVTAPSQGLCCSTRRSTQPTAVPHHPPNARLAGGGRQCPSGDTSAEQPVLLPNRPAVTTAAVTAAAVTAAVMLQHTPTEF